jgi:hypothetical protein
LWNIDWRFVAKKARRLSALRVLAGKDACAPSVNVRFIRKLEINSLASRKYF